MIVTDLEAYFYKLARDANSNLDTENEKVCCFLKG